LIDVIEMISIKLEEMFKECNIEQYIEESIENDLIREFVKWYFRLVNQLAKYNLLFINKNFFKENEFSEFKTENKNLTIDIRVEILRYIFIVDMNIVKKIVDENEVFSNYYSINSKEKKNFLNYIKFETNDLTDYSNYLKTNLDNFREFISSIENSEKIREIEKVELMFYYFENCIVDPFYTIILFYDKKRKELELEGYYRLYQFLNQFYIILKEFYLITVNLDTSKVETGLKKSINLDEITKFINNKFKLNEYKEHLNYFSECIKLIIENEHNCTNKFKIRDEDSIKVKDPKIFSKIEKLKLIENEDNFMNLI